MPYEVSSAVAASSVYRNVKTSHGAKGDGTTNDTTAVQAGIDAVDAAGGGTLYFPRGTYRVAGLVMKDNVILRGEGERASILRLVDASTSDVLTSENFGTLTGGTTRGGPEGWGLENIGLDGNRAGAGSGGYCIRVFGAAYRLHNVEIDEGAAGGVWSEWGTGGTNMEAQWTNVRIHDCNGKGLDWQGPHDSVFTNVMVFKNSTHGVHTRGNATSEQFVNCHIWGTEHDFGFLAEATAYCQNCQVEGATTANVRIKASNFSFIGGAVFGTGAAGETGFEFGDGTAGTYGGTVIVGPRMSGFQGAGSFALKRTNTTAGSYIWIQLFNNGGAAAISGTFAATDTVTVNSNDSTARSAESFVRQYGKLAHYPPASDTSTIVWKNNAGSDLMNWNSSSGRMELNNATDLRMFSGNFTGQTIQLDGAGFIDMAEITAPGAPAVNTARLYVDDSGAKSRLMVRFNTGAAIQLAIEP